MGEKKKQVNLLLKSKASFGKESTLSLGQLVDQYPYAPIFHFLYLRSLQQEDSYKFPSQLNRSSVSTMNRSALFDWAEESLVPIEVQMAAVKKRLSDRTLIQSEIESKNEIQIREEDSDEKHISDVQEFKKNTKSSTSKIEIVKVKKTSMESLDLSTLPDKVKIQILRSRAIKEQLSRNRKGNDGIPIVKDLDRKNDLDRKENETVKKVKTIVLEDNIEKLEKTDLPIVRKKKTQVNSNEKAPHIKKNNLDEDFNFQDKIKKPKVFLKSPEHSEFTNLSPFAQFLQGLKNNGPKIVTESSRERSTERKILEQFLELNPKISFIKGDENISDLTLKTPNVSGLVTETLANHYYDQGAFMKAIQAYEILKLKVPQKSGIFAARISEMRNLQSDKK